MKSHILFSVFVLVLVFGCTSVKTRNAKKVSEPLFRQQISENIISDENKKANSDLADSKRIYRDRLKDTTIIYNRAPGTPSDKFDTQFKNAMIEFDSSKFDLAYKLFRDIAINNIAGNDLTIFSKFYMAECRMSDNSFAEPEKIYYELINSTNVLPDIRQRALVRLGQLFCVTDRKDEAQKCFSRLKNEYSDSKYLKVSDCNAVTK